MATGKSQPGSEYIQQLPNPTQPEAIATSPPTKRDLASWWRQFKRNTRKEEPKEEPRGIFGVPLNVSIKYANVAISLTNDNGESFIYGYVPIVVAKCGVFLKEKATDVEGIFRLNGSAKRIKDLQEMFDSPERYGKGLDWSGYTVHDAANVLRRYLNQLPEPIVPLEFYERFRQPLRIYQKQVQANGQSQDPEAATFDHAKAVATYQHLIRELPPLNKQLLLYILDLLAVFASKSDQNRMTSANLSAIFQPGLLSHPQHDMAPDEYRLSQDVLIFLIENQDHFLFGMNGTAADEQTVKELESGLTARPTSHATVRRSVSNASGGTEGYRKSINLRRNVSVSSKTSRNSNNAPSPGTPNSLAGGGVHRSNTLPSKMSPVIAPSRYGKPAESANTTSSGLNPSTQHSRSASRTPPPPTQEEPSRHTTNQGEPGSSTPGLAYVHTSTHGPIPVSAAERPAASEKPPLQDTLPSGPSPPPPVVTPTKERKLSSFFSRSPPPPGEHKESRQPNRLKKKRIPGSTSESAQSSSHSLQAAVADLNIHPVPRAVSGGNHGAVDSIPRLAKATSPGEEITPPIQQRAGNAPTQNEPVQPHAAENTLRPRASRTPSMNSRSSFTDQSDFDQPDDGSRAERRDNRRSWRFPRSSKRSNEQISLGFSSPPLGAVNPGAGFSTSSFGSSHQASKSSPSDLQQFAADPSNYPLSLDSEVSNTSNVKDAFAGSEPEKKSLLGKFKAKVAQVRDGVKDWESDRERAKSPAPSDAEKSVSSQTLSPNAVDLAQDNQKETFMSPPISPLPTSGMPPAIPEEPPTPESPVAIRAPEVAPKEKEEAIGAENAPTPDAAVASEAMPPLETAPIPEATAATDPAPISQAAPTPEAQAEAEPASTSVPRKENNEAASK